ncbi:MAG: tyrosine-protein phosphatase [Planctomycetota bacterium]|nr:tyrosine-protein phosphatase [Planctomycetota bacterium]
MVSAPKVGKSSAGASRGLGVALGVVALGLGGWGFWDAAIKPNVQPKRFGVVVPGQLYRSGELTPAATRDVVRDQGIKTIIDLGAAEPGTADDRRAQRTAEALGVRRVVFDLEGDASGDPNQYVAVLRLMMDPAAQPVLVHCGAGSQRTGCAVALYRMIVEGVPQAEAIDEARLYDHDPVENPKLTKMLDLYAGDVAASLKSGEPIPPGPPLE